MMFGKKDGEGKKKSGIEIILGGGDPDEGSDEGEDGESAKMEAKRMASRAMIKAAKMGDSEAHTEAMLDFLRACGLLDDEGEYKKNPGTSE